nr:cation:proton antiporter [Gordonia soli]
MASVLIGLLVMVVWTLLAGRLTRWRITGPLLMVAAGVAIGFTTTDEIGRTLNTVVAERIVELILALLLFVDAMEVKGGYFGGERGPVLRLLLIGLPLSILAAVGVGAVLLPGISLAVILVIACIVIPTDFAPAAAIVRDERIPGRVRHLLNVESGYNDGIIAPVFIFALALAGDNQHDTPLDALGAALPAAGYAVVIGAPIGLATAWLTGKCTAAGLTTPASIRMSLVLIPLLSYSVALSVEGNGFVAAFICGLAYRAARSTPPSEPELSLVDDVSILTSLAMWFVFGSAVVMLGSMGLDWRLIVFALAALTVLRMVPVYLSLIGTDFARRDRVMIGLLGPRGTASIVFGLLAYNALDDAPGDQTLYAMAAVVIGSVVIHGAGSGWAAEHYPRSRQTSG